MCPCGNTLLLESRRARAGVRACVPDCMRGARPRPRARDETPMKNQFNPTFEMIKKDKESEKMRMEKVKDEDKRRRSSA